MTLLRLFVAWLCAKPTAQRKRYDYRCAPADHFTKFGDYIFANASFERVAAIGAGTGASMLFPTWIAGGAPSGTFNYNLAYGNGVWVAVNDTQSNVNVSTNNGTSWTSEAPGGGMGANNPIAYGANLFLLVEQGGFVKSSPDGVSWSNVTIPASGDAQCVFFVGGLFIVPSVSISTTYYSSPDGVNWSVESIPGNRAANCQFAFGGGVYVCIPGGTTTGYHSTDGATWSTMTLTSRTGYTSVAYGNGIFVAAASSSGTIQTSPDGVTWTASGSTSLQTCAFGNGYFCGMLGGSGTFYYSTNGTTWTTGSSGTTAPSGAFAFGNNVFMTINYSSGNTGASYTMLMAFAPNTPTKVSPSILYADPTGGINFVFTYNSVDGSPQSFYAFRLKVSGGSYLYWNATTNSLQSGIVWNANTTVNGGNWTVTIPQSAFTLGNVMNWSAASESSAGSIQGSFATDGTFTVQSNPTVAVTAPASIATTNVPFYAWTPSFASGVTQSTYEVVVETGTYGSTPGFGTEIEDTGAVVSTATQVIAAVALAPSATYAVFVQVVSSQGQPSSWVRSIFTVKADLEAQPLVTTVVVADPVTGKIVTESMIQGEDNQLTSNQASLESDVITGWAATV